MHGLLSLSLNYITLHGLHADAVVPAWRCKSVPPEVEGEIESRMAMAMAIGVHVAASQTVSETRPMISAGV